VLVHLAPVGAHEETARLVCAIGPGHGTAVYGHFPI
jgi:hypothetical protein